MESEGEQYFAWERKDGLIEAVFKKLPVCCRWFGIKKIPLLNCRLIIIKISKIEVV